jgi:hypothetical protein
MVNEGIQRSAQFVRHFGTWRWKGDPGRPYVRKRGHDRLGGRELVPAIAKCSPDLIARIPHR